MLYERSIILLSKVSYVYGAGGPGFLPGDEEVIFELRDINGLVCLFSRQEVDGVAEAQVLGMAHSGMEEQHAPQQEKKGILATRCLHRANIRNYGYKPA